jgi:CheY-like chemotaxis protein
MNHLCILIVDDDPEIRAAVRRSLRGPDCTIYEASDGVDAMVIVRNRPIDAVVSDYEMPRMNGLDLLQQVRMTRPDVLRVLLTGQADVQLAMRALNEGAADRFLLKPWDNVDLRGILRVGVHGHRSAETCAVGAR